MRTLTVKFQCYNNKNTVFKTETYKAVGKSDEQGVRNDKSRENDIHF